MQRPCEWDGKHWRRIGRHWFFHHELYVLLSLNYLLPSQSLILFASVLAVCTSQWVPSDNEFSKMACNLQATSHDRQGETKVYLSMLYDPTLPGTNSITPKIRLPMKKGRLTSVAINGPSNRAVNRELRKVGANRKDNRWPENHACPKVNGKRFDPKFSELQIRKGFMGF